MSRVGQETIKIEEGVDVSIDELEVHVKGPLGEMKINLPEDLEIKKEGREITLSRKNETKQAKSNHGTYRMLINNAVYGVKNGYSKNLELVGVGYRARMEGGDLVMSLGWNHPIKMVTPEGVQVEVPEETKITVKGFDKQKVESLQRRLEKSENQNLTKEKV